jgi:hypothetical protein
VTANEIGGKCWQPIVLILREAVFDRNVLALDIADFFQALTERGQKVWSSPAALLLRKPTTGIAGCCARATSGATRRLRAMLPMNVRRSIKESTHRRYEIRRYYAFRRGFKVPAKGRSWPVSSHQMAAIERSGLGG